MQDELKIRLDKWLWAARFYKTRSLAAEAVNGGKVHLNAERVKSAKMVKPGDQLRIRRGQEEWIVIVRGLNTQRRPAVEASRLYEETEDSKAAREQRAEERRIDALAGPQASHRRPNKKDRRHIVQFKRKNTASG